MCQALYGALPAVKTLFDKSSDILGYDLAEVCFRGPVEKLDSTVFSQPALYVCGMAALESLKATSPDVVQACVAAAGLSLGEYTAIAFAGGFDFEDGLRLVQRRGEAMQAASDATASGMVSVLGLDRDKVEEICNLARVEGEILQIANLLCPGNIAVSGHAASCKNVPARAEQAGAIKSIPLAVAGAFHTPIMESAVSRLAEALKMLNSGRLEFRFTPTLMRLRTRIRMQFGNCWCDRFVRPFCGKIPCGKCWTMELRNFMKSGRVGCYVDC